MDTTLFYKISPIRIILVAGILTLLSACAAPVTRTTVVDSAAMKREAEIQNEMALQTQQQHLQKLITLSHRIFTRSVSLCENKIPALGIIAGNRFSFRDEMHTAAHKVFGVNDHLRILIMATDSSAATAGLLPGDEIHSINGKPLPADKDAQKIYKEVLSKLGAEKKLRTPITLRIQRSKVSKIIHVTPDISCDYGYGLVSDDQINAFADGENVFVTTGMLRFVNDDNELALVLSHELAHNVMQHLDKKKQNSMLGSIFDIIAAGYGVNTQGMFGNLAAQRYSQEFESEADYVGLYMMALSGLPIENSHYFWRRMAAANPGGIKANHASSHPSTPQRFLSLEKTIGEIQRKQLGKIPLKPELQQK